MTTRLSRSVLILASICLSLDFASATIAQDSQRDEPQLPKIIRKSGGVLQASATKRVEPVYPPLAKAARVSGAVVVEVTSDEEGSVISARALSGHPLLKDSAVSAAQGWKFSPTMLSGGPVKVIGTITFNFVLDHRGEIEGLLRELTTNPNSAELHFNIGVLQLKDDNYVDAIASFTAAIGVDPNLAKSYVGL